MSILRMGWISQFMSKAVITGFLFGAAIDVIVGELPKLTGTSSEGSNVWQEFGSWIRDVGEVHPTTLLVGIVALAALFGLKRLRPDDPGNAHRGDRGLVASAVLDLGAYGVALVGDVPRGLPMPAIPDLQLVSDNLAHRRRRGDRHRGDRLLADRRRRSILRHQARLPHRRQPGDGRRGDGEPRSRPVPGDPRLHQPLGELAQRQRRAPRAPSTSLTTGAVVVLTLIVFAPVFSVLPKAVLGAVIIDAVISGMIDIPEMRRLYRVKRFDFGIAVAAILGVLSLGVLAGIVIGVVLSLGWLVHVTATPAMPVLGRVRGTHVFRELDAHPDDEQFPGILALRLDGGLFFVHGRRPGRPHPGGRPGGRSSVDGRRARLPGHRLHRLPGVGEARGVRRPGTRERHRLPAGSRQAGGHGGAVSRRRPRADRGGSHPHRRERGGHGAADLVAARGRLPIGRSI